MLYEDDEHKPNRGNAGAETTDNVSSNGGGRDFVTVLTSANGCRLTKRIELAPGGGFVRVDYDDKSKFYYFAEHPIGDLADMDRIFEGLDTTQSIVLGGIRNDVDRSQPLQRTHLY